MSNNTKNSFKDKWHKNVDLAFKETLRKGSDIQNWILNRNGWETLNDFESFLRDKKRVLDAGCGNGRVTALLAQNCNNNATLVGIDLVAADVAGSNLKEYTNVKTQQKDLLEDLSDIGKFDFIYSQEVLHHTDAPFDAFKNLVENSLENGGTIAIYVYKKKAALREYCDDFIRDKIANMSYEESMKVCDQITELGKTLSEQNVKIKVQGLDILGIEAGEYDMQRFIYHFFMKCFWSENLNFNENSVINYDWYHPQNCERYEVEEIREWYKKLDLKITHEFVDHYGITMHGIK
jgi:SAM-dependent methyltransferase